MQIKCVELNENNILFDNCNIKNRNTNIIYPKYKYNNNVYDNLVMETNWFPFFGYITDCQWVNANSIKTKIRFINNNFSQDILQSFNKLDKKFENFFPNSMPKAQINRFKRPNSYEPIIKKWGFSSDDMDSDTDDMDSDTDDKNIGKNIGKNIDETVFGLSIGLDNLHVTTPIFVHEIDNNNNLFIKRLYNLKLNDFRELLIHGKSKIKMLIQLDKLWYNTTCRSNDNFGACLIIKQIEINNL